MKTFITSLVTSMKRANADEHVRKMFAAVTVLLSFSLYCAAQTPISRVVHHPTLYTRNTITYSNNSFKIVYCAESEPANLPSAGFDVKKHFLISYIEYPLQSKDILLPSEYEVEDMQIFDSYCYFSGRYNTGGVTMEGGPLYNGFVGRFKIPSTLNAPCNTEIIELPNLETVQRIAVYHPSGDYSSSSIAAIAVAGFNNGIYIQQLLSLNCDANNMWTAKKGGLPDINEVLCDIVCNSYGDSIYLVSRFSNDDHKLCFREYSQRYVHFLDSPTLNVSYEYDLSQVGVRIAKRKMVLYPVDSIDFALSFSGYDEITGRNCVVSTHCNANGGGYDLGDMQIFQLSPDTGAILLDFFHRPAEKKFYTLYCDSCSYSSRLIRSSALLPSAVSAERYAAKYMYMRSMADDISSDILVSGMSSSYRMSVWEQTTNNLGLEQSGCFRPSIVEMRRFTTKAEKLKIATVQIYDELFSLQGPFGLGWEIIDWEVRCEESVSQ